MVNGKRIQKKKKQSSREKKKRNMRRRSSKKVDPHSDLLKTKMISFIVICSLFKIISTNVKGKW